MSKSEILKWFTTNSEELQADRILFVMLMGIAVGVIIFLTYRVTFRGVSYNARFNCGNIALLLISATIMLMISTNIVISLGMVGALSIVRFRTAVKDTQDTVYIFWSIIEGLCVGSQNYKLALVSTLVIAIFMLISSFYMTFRKTYLIIIHGDGSLRQEDVLDSIREACPKAKIRSANVEEGHCELICEVRIKGEFKEDMLEDVMGLDGVNGVNWLLEMGEYVG